MYLKMSNFIQNTIRRITRIHRIYNKNRKESNKKGINKMGKMTNDFEVVSHENIKRINNDEWERVADASNLYISLKKAYEGDTEGLSKQVYYVSYMRAGCLHKYIRYTDRRLNNFAIRMKKKYGDSSMTSKEPLQVGDGKIGALIDRKAFEEYEIDDMIINFIYSFNKSFIELENNTYINVPNILSFKGEDDQHSNNKLMSYLLGSNGEIGMIEVAILKTMEQRKASRRFMINGVSHKVNLNDLDEVRHDDIDTPKDSDGNQMNVDDLIGKEDEGYSKVDDTTRIKGYDPTKEMAYIMGNLERVLTKNQYEKFMMLTDLIDKGKVDINDLFHDVTDSLIYVELGKVWFPDRKNNHVQPAVRSLLEGMRKRMRAAIELQGYVDDKGRKGLQSSYRRLEGHEMEDNRLYNEYDLDRWVHRVLEVDRFHQSINGNYSNSDQFIPYEEMERVERHEQSVSDVIKKYRVSKDRKSVV